MIHSKLVFVYYTIVIIIAINIPIEANLLPFLAVAGDANCFSPMMNKEADKR